MMFPALDPGLPREMLAILSLYLGTLLNGYSFAFSAVAIPDITMEMRWDSDSTYYDTEGILSPLRNNASLSFLPKILASDEELSWFGKDQTPCRSNSSKSSKFQPALSTWS